jgi:hypothetical protein
MNFSSYRLLHFPLAYKLLVAAVLLVASSGFPPNLLAERTLRGRVVNGTTNAAGGGQRVELLTLGEGMNKTAETMTSGDGSFDFSLPENTRSPHWLLRAIYQGVNYNLSVTPDQDLAQPVTLTIYETTQSTKGLEVSLPLMLAQASGNLLYVQQQYLLNNATSPKRTLTNTSGTFLFDTPARELLSDLTVSVVGLAGIPLPQEPTPRKEGGYVIAYPMKPGVNEIRVSYKVNFPSNQRGFSHRLFYPTGSTKMLVLPATLQVSGPGLQPSGTDSRMQAAVYQVPESNAALQFKIVGDAPQVAEEGGQGDTRGDEPQVKVVRLSNRVFENRMFILSGFGALFAVAFIIALRRKATAKKQRK